MIHNVMEAARGNGSRPLDLLDVARSTRLTADHIGGVTEIHKECMHDETPAASSAMSHSGTCDIVSLPCALIMMFAWVTSMEPAPAVLLEINLTGTCTSVAYGSVLVPKLNYLTPRWLHVAKPSEV